MRKKIMMVMTVMFTVAALSQAALVTDDFNRANSTNLGVTAQGDAWKRQYVANIKPAITGNLMHWEDSSDMIYVDGIEKIKDVTMTFDFLRPTEQIYGAHSFVVNFRMNSRTGSIANGGTQGGYLLRIYTDAAQKITATLKADTDNGGDLATGFVSTAVGAEWSGAISLVASGNNFKVAINGTEVIDFTDASGNTGKDAAGYFSFQGNASRDFEMDNLNVIPEPTTMSLVVISGMAALAVRRFKI